MNTLSRDDVLSLLGCGSDPKHSLSWFSNKYPNLDDLLKIHISEELNNTGIFPMEAQKLTTHKRATDYLLIAVKKSEKTFSVVIHDTDHGTIISEHDFLIAEDAATFFIEKSYCAGGAIKDYLHKKQV